MNNIENNDLVLKTAMIAHFFAIKWSKKMLGKEVRSLLQKQEKEP